MCTLLDQNIHESIQTSLTNQADNPKLGLDLLPLETICEQINQILSLEEVSASEVDVLDSNKEQAAVKNNLLESQSPSIQLNNGNPSTLQDTEMKDTATESELQKGGSVLIGQELNVPPYDNIMAAAEACTSPKRSVHSPETTKNEIKTGAIPSENETASKSKSEVVILDD